MSRVDDRAKVVAYQLSLLGDAPKPMRGWRPTFYTWSFWGMAIPPSDDAKRQAMMLRDDTKPWRSPLHPEDQK